MSMSRVPSNKFERCCICFVMEDRRPSLGADGRSSTIEMSSCGECGGRGRRYAWRILLIPGIGYQEIAIDRAIDRQETAQEAASERPRLVNNAVYFAAFF